MYDHIPRPATQPLFKQFEAFQSSYQGDTSPYFMFGDQLFSRGYFKEASWYYLESIYSQHDKAIKALELEYAYSANCFYQMKDFASAAFLQQKIADEKQDDLGLLTNLGIYLYKLDRARDAEDYFNKALAINATFPTALAWLARIYDDKGDIKKCRQYGNERIKQFDEQAHVPANIKHLQQLTRHKIEVNSPVPIFNPDTSAKNIIAFSLWGDKPHYYEGAKRNAIIARALYPGWRCRFYCNETVQESFREELGSLGAQVAMMESHGNTAFDGLFWRFLTANDDTVDRYLIRDCDSLLTCKERIAVDEWISSGKHFHVMRDSAAHTVLMLAGLWGGVRGALPSLAPLINDFLKNNMTDRFNDQAFLANYIWPFVKQSYLAHDSVYEFDNSQQYQKFGDFPSKQWALGGNWFVQPSS